MDSPVSHRIHLLSLPPVPNHLGFLLHPSSSDSVISLRPQILRIRRVQDHSPIRLRLRHPSSSAASRVPDLRLLRRRPDAETDADGAVPPEQPVRRPPRSRVLGGGAAGSRRVRRESDSVHEVREREDDREGELRHVPWTDDGGEHAPRGCDSAEGRW